MLRWPRPPRIMVQNVVFGKLVPNPICVPNLKLLASTVAKIRRGSQIFFGCSPGPDPRQNDGSPHGRFATCRLLRDTTVDGSYSEMIRPFAPRKALATPSHYYCRSPDSSLTHPYIVYIIVCPLFKAGFVTVMWSAASPGDIEPNHIFFACAVCPVSDPQACQRWFHVTQTVR